ncbi:hypothetical protein CR513_31140, partial [Mucuna pruriens]
MKQGTLGGVKGKASYWIQPRTREERANTRGSISYPIARFPENNKWPSAWTKTGRVVDIWANSSRIKAKEPQQTRGRAEKEANEGQ